MREVFEERRQKWLEALRSGEYEQGVGSLKRNGAYCCLGVACDVFKKLTGRGEWKRTAEGTYHFVLGDKRAEVYPPKEVSDFFGIEENGEIFVKTQYHDGEWHGSHDSLDGMNDSGNWTFEDIADVIEGKPVDKKSRGLEEF